MKTAVQMQIFPKTLNINPVHKFPDTSRPIDIPQSKEPTMANAKHALVIGSFSILM
jgi:hypothetical protein